MSFSLFYLKPFLEISRYRILFSRTITYLLESETFLICTYRSSPLLTHCLLLETAV